MARRQAHDTADIVRRTVRHRRRASGAMKHEHGLSCPCAPCRHARFNPGPATSGRRITFYGAFSRKAVRHRGRIQSTADAIREGAKPEYMPKWMRRAVALLLGSAR